MTIVEPFTHLLSVSVQKKFGKPTGYGQIKYGVGYYGLGDPLAGIYQQRHCKTGIRTIKMKFYSPVNPGTPAQLIEQDRMRSAVAAWHNLTDGQRLVYNSRAVGKHMSGFNLFIKEY